MKGILLEVDAYVPTAESWHRDLLLQASIASDERPAIISGSIHEGLNEMLAFRHAVRNNYATTLRHADVFRNVALAQVTVPGLLAEVELFLEQFDDHRKGNRPTAPKG